MNCTDFYFVFYELLERQAEFDPILDKCVFIYKLTWLSIFLIVLLSLVVLTLFLLIGLLIYFKCIRKAKKKKEALLSRIPRTLPELLTELHRESSNITDLIAGFRYLDSRHKKKWNGYLQFSHDSIVLEPSYIYEAQSFNLTITNYGKPVMVELSTYCLYAYRESYRVTFYPSKISLSDNESVTINAEVIMIKPEMIPALVVVKVFLSNLTREGEYASPYYLPLKIRGLALVNENLIVSATELAGGELIGSGAAASVYRTFLHGKEVAVKKYRIADLTKTDVDEFMKELLILAKVNHPNVVRLIAASTTYPHLMVAMEYLPLGSLRKVLNEKELTIPLKLKFAYDAARALAYLHSLGIVHRDIKSENLLIVSLNLLSVVTLKVTDFSLGKMVKRDSLPEHRIKEREIGSIQWASPELLNGSPADEMSDCWAYGVVCYEIITGRIPYSQFKFHHEIEEYIKNGNKLPLTADDCQGFPEEFRDLVLDCFYSCCVNEARRKNKRPTFEEIASRICKMRIESRWNRIEPNRSMEIREGIQI
jgi:tRNA A-37 threonylcarbamoyl transferase component Bud32